MNYFNFHYLTVSDARLIRLHLHLHLHQEINEA